MKKFNEQPVETPVERSRNGSRNGARKENLFTPDCIRTFSGHYVNGLNPDPATITIEDIAHALARTARFSGHTHGLLTVAQHSVYVSLQLPEDLQLAGLLHDASEAYLNDIVRPWKRHLPDYNKLEDRLMTVIAEKFGFDYPMHALVHMADLAALKMEWDQAMLTDSLHCLDYQEAERRFLRHYYQIIGEPQKESA